MIALNLGAQGKIIHSLFDGLGRTRGAYKRFRVKLLRA
jgi:hypothetical protein